MPVVGGGQRSPLSEFEVDAGVAAHPDLTRQRGLRSRQHGSELRLQQLLDLQVQYPYTMIPPHTPSDGLIYWRLLIESRLSALNCPIGTRSDESGIVSWFRLEVL